MHSAHYVQLLAFFPADVQVERSQQAHFSLFNMLAELQLLHYSNPKRYCAVSMQWLPHYAVLMQRGDTYRIYNVLRGFRTGQGNFSPGHRNRMLDAKMLT